MPETYTITLNSPQWQAVVSAAEELSYRVAQPILAEILKQIHEQQQPKKKSKLSLVPIKGKPDGKK